MIPPTKPERNGDEMVALGGTEGTEKERESMRMYCVCPYVEVIRMLTLNLKHS